MRHGWYQCTVKPHLFLLYWEGVGIGFYNNGGVPGKQSIYTPDNPVYTYPDLPAFKSRLEIDNIQVTHSFNGKPLFMHIFAEHDPPPARTCEDIGSVPNDKVYVAFPITLQPKPITEHPLENFFFDE